MLILSHIEWNICKGHWMLMALISKRLFTVRPLRWILKWFIYHSILKKGSPYVSAIKVIFDMSAINIHCPLQIFHSIWNNISKVQLPGLPLLLFHFIWNHNSKGIVSPPFRPKVLWEFHFFCVTPYYVKNPSRSFAVTNELGEII